MSRNGPLNANYGETGQTVVFHTPHKSAPKLTKNDTISVIVTYRGKYACANVKFYSFLEASCTTNTVSGAKSNTMTVMAISRTPGV